ncbi:MAG: MOSC domain-containing protein [Acidobacteriota bacterium]
MVPKISAICVSKRKGTRKKEVQSVRLIKDYGIEGDAHAGSEKRQVSILTEKSIEHMKSLGLKLNFGDFGENIVVRGLSFEDFKKGDLIRLGKNALGEVTVLGKECHTRCAIFYKTGDCIMPREGVFLKITKGGKIKKGDRIRMVQRK